MLAGRLQRGTTTLAARMEEAVRVRLHLPPAPGAGAALCRGLRAGSRRCHRPTGQIQQPGRTQDWIKLGGKVNDSKARSKGVRQIAGALCDSSTQFGELLSRWPKREVSFSRLPTMSQLPSCV